MITEFLINCFCGISSGFFEFLPDVTWTVDTTAWQYLKDFLDMISYLLPMGTIKTIVALIFDIAVFRIVVSILRTVLGLIPFV